MKARKLTILLCCLLGYSCTSLDQRAKEYSEKWRAASVEQRGTMADPDFCYRYLKGKGRKEVEAFLGKPKEAAEEYWTYDLGTMGGGPYHWTLWVHFDSDGVVENVVGDD